MAIQTDAINRDLGIHNDNYLQSIEIAINGRTTRAI